MNATANIRRVVRFVIPFSDFTIVAGGEQDDGLLDLEGRPTETLVRSGGDPLNDVDAIARMESLRRAGARFLILPSWKFWWLDRYSALQRYLDLNCRVAV